MTHRVIALVLLALVVACTSAPAPSPSVTLTVEASPSASAPATPTASPTGAGRIVTFYAANDQRIAPVGGVTTVCDFYLRGTVFDFRSGVAYRIEPVAPKDRQPYFGQQSADDSGSWRSPVISLTEGEWNLTVVGALTHPDQTYAIRVACPGGRTPTPSPVPTIKPLAGAGKPTLLEPFAQGRLSGKVAWVTKVAAAATGTQGVARSSVLELWAVPLDRSTPRLAVRYRSTFFVGAAFGDTNVLRRQFSPDGRQIVLSIATGADADGHGLAVIDLESGRLVTMIGGAAEQELSPAWSPDGRLIAFVRPAASEFSSEIWVVAPDGSGARRLRAGTTGTRNRIFGWTPDSARIGFSPIDFERTSYALIDLSGVVTDQTDRILNAQTAVDWRTRSPAFAMSFTDSPFTPTRSNVIVADDPAQQSPRIVADVVVDPSDNRVTGVRSPRWDPSGRDRLIYLESGIQGSFVLADISFVTITKKQIGSRVAFAEWMPDGSAIVTLEEHPSTAPLAVYVWDANGSLVDGGIFLASQGPYQLTDLSPRGY